MKVDVLGVKIDSLTFNQAVEKIKQLLNQRQQHLIITANAELLLKCLKNLDLNDIVNQASLVTADGIGPIWAAHYLNNKRIKANLLTAYFSALGLIFRPAKYKNVIPERTAGADLFKSICQIASKDNQSIFFLGGKPGVAEKMIENLKKSFPDLKIGGFSDQPENVKIADSEQWQKIIENINRTQAQILFVAYGAPFQEIWLNQNLSKMPAVKIALGVGGTFDFYAGKVVRAPKIIQRLGLEWLWRLIIQPWRIIRIINATFKFIYEVWKFNILNITKK